jgi:mannose-6-phosphate isomerase-like protein (cupin superfamily)
MKHVITNEREAFFDVVAGTGRSQAAVMILDPGGSTGGADNRHPESDQWLFVVAGSGTATIEGREIDLEPGSLVLIEAGEAHEIACALDEPLRTINVYAPPAY